MIELKLASKSPSGTITLCYNDDKFGATKTIELEYKSNKLIKRLHFFEKKSHNLYFLLDNESNEFHFEHLRLARVLRWFAIDRMLKKIQTKHPEYSGRSLKNIKKSLKNKALEREQIFSDITKNHYDELFQIAAPLSSYQQWIQKVERPERLNLKNKAAASDLKFRPLISLVVPTYNTPIVYLRRCIESVISQSYANWELCIADDASTDQEVKQTLKNYASQDKRLKLKLRKFNGHISEASNSALQFARGDFVAFLDHDDELAPDALYHVVKTINEKPDAKIIYSDEDKIDAEDNRYDPHFKPDWSPDLLYSQNYISHLCVYDSKLINAVGGFRKGYEGSQDHDLLLRCVDLVKPDEIVHIPKILYHWRSVSGSTALTAAEKNYTTKAGVKALADYFGSKNTPVNVRVGMLPNTYKIDYAISEPHPKVSLIIPTRNQHRVLSKCIDSILEKTKYPNFEILIINNKTTDPESLEYFRDIQQHPKIRIIDYDHPFNFSSINNFGINHALGTVVGLLNNDIEVISPDWLGEMLKHVARPEIGCVGAKLYYPDGKIQHAGVILGIGGVAGHSHKYFNRDEHGYFSRLKIIQNVSDVTAACLLVRKDVYEEVCGLNERLAVAFNDVDFCLKVREAGYRNIWTPYAELYHHESISRGYENTPAKQKRFSKEVSLMKMLWQGKLDQDPYYNPNLTKDHENFAIELGG
ncbi:MAG: glycosyltransferase family 2 protein [Desulfobacterales bacterium]